MRINHNLMSLNTHRQLTMNLQAQSESTEKLSSGLRINRASDDAAGLSISEKMRGQIRGLNQSVRNAQDSISLIQTADGAAAGIHSMLQRARELGVQAVNGTLTDSDRAKVQIEIDELVSQVDTVANTTEFNTKKLLNSAGASAFAGVSQSALDLLGAKIPMWLDSALTSISTQLGIALPDSPTKRPMDVTYYYDPLDNAAASMGTATAGASLTLRVNLAKATTGDTLISEDQLDTLIAHEVVHALEFTEMPYSLAGGAAGTNWFTEGLAMTIQGGSFFPVTDHTVSQTDPFDGDYRSAYEAVKALHEITVGGIAAFIDELEAGNSLDQAFANTTQNIAGTELAAATGSADFNTVAGYLAWFNANGSNGILAYLSGNDFNPAYSGAITNGSVQGSSSTLSLADTIIDSSSTSVVDTHFALNFTNPGTSQSAMTFQIGANTGQTVDMSAVNLTAQSLGIQGLDLSTQNGASSSISKVDAAITLVSYARSSFGALQNRLEHTVRNLEVSAENLQASESRIRDVDIAKQMMHFTKNNILVQAAQSILAQANQQPQSVLQLLK